MTCGVILLCVSCLHVCVPFWKGRGREGEGGVVTVTILRDDVWWWYLEILMSFKLQYSYTASKLPKWSMYSQCLSALSLSICFVGRGISVSVYESKQYPTLQDYKEFHFCRQSILLFQWCDMSGTIKWWHNFSISVNHLFKRSILLFQWCCDMSGTIKRWQNLGIWVKRQDCQGMEYGKRCLLSSSDSCR